METLMSFTSLMMRPWDCVWHGVAPGLIGRLVMLMGYLVQELNDHGWVLGEEHEQAVGEANREQYRHLGKHAQPVCDGKLSSSLAPLPGVTRVGTLEAMHMPKMAGRPLRSSSCRFPYASPVSPSGTGKQKTAPKGRPKKLISLRKFGAGEGIRTLDPNLGKVVLALGSACAGTLRQR
jgi:hypothetical protein